MPQISPKPSSISTRDARTLKRYDRQGLKRKTIAGAMDMTPQQVSKVSKELGLVPRRFPATIERLEKVERLHNDGLTNSQIGTYFGITPSAVSHLLNLAEKIKDKAYQVQKLKNSGMSVPAIADKFGVSPSTIYYYLNRARQLYEDRNRWIIYINDKPAAWFDNKIDADTQAEMLQQKKPDADIVVKSGKVS